MMTTETIKRVGRYQKPLKVRIAPILAGAIRTKREATGQTVRFKK